MGLTVQKILAATYPALLARYRLPQRMLWAAFCLRFCRTERLGYHARRCPHGHVESVHYNSCKHRSCPQCAWLSVERWMAQQQERLLACEHFHVVFTLHKELRPLWRWNVREFGRLFFDAARGALLELLADPKYLGAKPGILMALHTWNKQLVLHPHIHALVTAGGLDDEGCWRRTRKKWLLPRRVLTRKFQGKLRALLLSALDNDRLRLPPDHSSARIRSLLNRLGRLHLNVKILESYQNGQSVVKYLARYLRGGPLSNRRLVCFQDGQVTFRYRDSRELDVNGRNKQKTITLPVMKFLLRLLQHVPPRGFTMVRRAGLYANSNGDLLTASRELLGSTWKPSRAQTSWCHDADAAMRCPVCGSELICQRIPRNSRSPPRRTRPVFS